MAHFQDYFQLWVEHDGTWHIGFAYPVMLIIILIVMVVKGHGYNK